MYAATTPINCDAFDRFGRAVRQQWEKYVVSPPSSTTIDQFDYAYDYAGNRLSRDVPATLYATNNRDQLYAYDGLMRLQSMDEGTLSGSTISGTPAKEQDWTLDALGNWARLINKTAGTTVLDQLRQTNRANELDPDDHHDNTPGGGIVNNVGPGIAWHPSFDAAGNMRSRGIKRGHSNFNSPGDLTGTFYFFGKAECSRSSCH